MLRLMIFLHFLEVLFCYSCQSQNHECNSDMNSFRDINDLIEWVRSNNGTVRGMQIEQISPDNRYVVASEDIEEGEIINAIPFDLMITAANEKINLFCQKNSLKEYKICLAFYFYLEIDNPNSEHRHFFNTLPSDLSSHPIFFNERELSLIEGSFIKTNIDERRSKFKKEIDIIIANGYKEEISIDKYMKCRSLVASRNFGISQNETKFNALVPIADLYNFEPSKVNLDWYYDEDKRMFEIKTIRKIKKDEQLYVNYGADSNMFHLMVYGFTIENPKKRMSVYFNHQGQVVKLSTHKFELDRVLKAFRINRTEYTLANEISSLKMFKENLLSRINALSINGTNVTEVLNKAVEANDFNLVNIYRVLMEEIELYEEYIRFTNELISILGYQDIEKIIEGLNKLKERKQSPFYIKNLLKVTGKALTK